MTKKNPTFLEILRAYAEEHGNHLHDIYNETTSNAPVTMVAASDYLFRQGDHCDGIYVVMEGELIVESPDFDGEIYRLRERDSIGEADILSGGIHSVSVRAVTDSALLKFHRDRVYELASDLPGLITRLVAAEKSLLNRLYLAQAMTRYLGKLSETDLDLLEAHFDWHQLERGDVLISQGEIGDRMYVVLTGRLNAVRTNEDETHVLGEIEPGDMVGEGALFDNSPRTANVVAVRSTHVASINRQGFEQLVHRHPEFAIQLTGIITRRLQAAQNPAATVNRSTNHTFAICPIGNKEEIHQFITQALLPELEYFGDTLVLDASAFDDLLEVAGISQTPIQAELSLILDRRLVTVEQNHNYIIYLCDDHWSAWTQRCINQADDILIVATADASPDLSAVEQLLLKQYPDTKRELVLLHPPETKRPVNTRRWLLPERCHRHHHVRLNDPMHTRRLARRMTRSSVALIISGGGARSYSAIGMIHALRDRGIEIDLIAGSSAGGHIALMYGMLSNVPDMYQVAAEVDPTEGLEWTFPMVALTTGRGADTLLQRVYGDVQIEDFWTPTFVTVSDITRGRGEILMTGPAWLAARICMSLPGLWPPVFRDGRLYLDGGFVNNLPSNIVREQFDAHVVVAYQTLGNPPKDVDEYDMTTTMNGWRALFNRYNPFIKKKLRFPLLYDIFVRSAFLHSNYIQSYLESGVDLLIDQHLGDGGLIDFSRTDEFLQIGFDFTDRAIEEYLSEDDNLLAQVNALHPPPDR
ncbi:MAG: cyclic nucleotide-binding and patatin-like phospholipase domain-containing protein [Chloroflexota bacterium]